jgi:mRNA interferase MazF
MRGEVVVAAFPFSDQSQSRKRPALILIDLPGADAVLAAITTGGKGPHAIALETKDFQKGALNHPSYIHPAKLFTFQKNLIESVVGNITETKRKEVVSKLVVTQRNTARPDLGDTIELCPVLCHKPALQSDSRLLSVFRKGGKFCL